MSTTVNPAAGVLSLAALLAPVSDADKLDLFFRLLAGAIRGQPASSVTLDQLAAQLTASQTAILKEIKTMSDTFDTEITQLRTDVAAQGTVIASATTAFQGLAAQLAAAEQAAKNAGATDAQIASVAAVRQGLEANTAALAAAIPANTPAATGTDTTGAPAGAGTQL